MSYIRYKSLIIYIYMYILKSLCRFSFETRPPLYRYLFLSEIRTFYNIGTFYSYHYEASVGTQDDVRLSNIV